MAPPPPPTETPAQRATRLAAEAEALQEQLNAAIKAGDLALLDTTLDAKARPNTAPITGPDAGKTPLEAALELADAGKKEAIVKKLHEHGADMNAKKGGKTLLEQAYERNDLAGIKLLTENGADPNIAAEGHAKLLLRAIKDNKPEIAEALAKKADPNVKDAEGYTALQWAIEKNNVKLVNTLLDKGADANDKGKDELPPLLNAIQKGNKEIVTALLKHGADVNAADENGLTALMMAIGGEHPEITKIILEQKDPPVNINAAHKGGSKALHWAADHGDSATLKALLEKGADIDEKFGNSQTALNIAKEKARAHPGEKKYADTADIIEKEMAERKELLAKAGQAVDDLHHALDKNKDGLVSFEETVTTKGGDSIYSKASHAKIAALDLNKDGEVSKEEIAKAMDASHLAKTDTHGKEFSDFSAFRKSLEKAANVSGAIHHDGKLADAEKQLLAKLDANSDNKITKEEFRASVIGQADKNHDGHISKSEARAIHAAIADFNKALNKAGVTWESGSGNKYNADAAILPPALAKAAPKKESGPTPT